MRLVIVTPFLETRGGMERVVLKIAKHFDAKINCIRYDAAHTFDEFKNLEVELAKPGLFSKLPMGKRVSGAIEAGNHFYNLKLDDYDLVNAHQTPSEWARNKNKPMIWYCHTPNREAFDLYDWRMKQRNPIQKAIFWSSIQAFKHFEFASVPKIEYIFTNSRNSQDRIKKYLKRDSEVLYPGVDLERFKCKDFEKFFFYPSRIAPEKRIEYAIDAFRIFSKDNPGWKLIVAGSLSDRKEHITYYERIKSMIGNESIVFMTNIKDAELLDLYSRCTAVLFSAINEDFGLVPLEAFAASKPCISVNEGGPKETIDNGTDGFLVNTPQEMAKKMEILARAPELAEELGKKGRYEVETKFTWKRFLTRFEQKAQELIKEKNQ